MEWIGIGMAIVGAVLVYSAARDLHPWTEFQAALKTGAAPAGKTGVSVA